MAIGDDLDTYHQDGLMSTMTQVSKSSGSLYSSNLYKEFGQSERFINDQAGYRSQYHDNWQAIHLRAREYDTTTGRFTQQDTVLGDLENPVTQNKYVYANNNPFMYRDDAGRKSGKVVGGLGAIFSPIGSMISKMSKFSNLTYSMVSKAIPVVYDVMGSVYGIMAKNGFPHALELQAKMKQAAQESRKKAEARKQKMCEEAEAKKLKSEADREKENLEKAFGKPDSQGRYRVNDGAGHESWFTIDDIHRVAKGYQPTKTEKVIVGLAGALALAYFTGGTSLPITIRTLGLTVSPSGVATLGFVGERTITISGETLLAGVIAIAGAKGSGGDSSDSKSLKDMSNGAANDFAKKNGYKDAHDFKETFVGREGISKFDMKYDSKTFEIILEQKRNTSNLIRTGYYIK
jgi:RHS repeat-associated protein